MWVLDILEALLDALFRRKGADYEAKFKPKRTPRGKRVR